MRTAWKKQLKTIFTPEERAVFTPLLADVRARLALSGKHTERMLGDHVAALRWCLDHGLSAREAAERFAPAQLGDFYLAEREDWYPLDTAAKIYPLSMGLKRMMVFRMSGYLTKPVEPVILQMALTYTMRRFPYFATTIKCGFFWHYIDGVRRRFAVRPETKLPCSVMRVNAGASPSLRVVYYQNRVSVEFFHILTDGTGASVFLRTLLREYLRLLGCPTSVGDGVFELSDAPDPHEWADDFHLTDKGGRAKGFADKRAVQLRGLAPYEQPNRVLHYNLSVAALKAQAHEKNTTITALLMGYLMLAYRDAAEPFPGKKKIQVQLPVNMRKFYPSRTLRNFSMYCSIRLAPREITTLDEVLPLISAQIADGASKESLDRTMTLSLRLVRLLRFLPLIVKRPIAYLLYGQLSDGVFTSTFSNMGAITVPPEMAPYLDKFDFVLGPPVRNRAVCSLCSYGDKAVLTVTKNTTLTTFEDALYAHLREGGFEPYMEGSG